MDGGGSSRCFLAGEADANKSLVAALRGWLPDCSWSQVRHLIHTRRVTVNHALCLDDGRRLMAGDSVQLRDESLPPAGAADVRIHYLDDDLVVVEKPPRMMTLRHHAEKHWPARRKARQPTLDEIVPQRLLQLEGRRAARGHRRPRIYSVHRIDRDTSGLLVFARDEVTQQRLIEQFARHDVDRAYLAIVPGWLAAQTIASWLVRDRGDGLRGSSPVPAKGQHAVTHVRPLQSLGEYSLLECRLETGRTHQIRIHLAELGHPVCGDPIYRGPLGSDPLEDRSQAPRLALHAARLGFTHPSTGQPVHWELPLPPDLRRFVERLGKA